MGRCGPIASVPARFHAICYMLQEGVSSGTGSRIVFFRVIEPVVLTSFAEPCAGKSALGCQA